MRGSSDLNLVDLSSEDIDRIIAEASEWLKSQGEEVQPKHTPAPKNRFLTELAELAAMAQDLPEIDRSTNSVLCLGLFNLSMEHAAATQFQQAKQRKANVAKAKAQSSHAPKKQRALKPQPPIQWREVKPSPHTKYLIDGLVKLAEDQAKEASNQVSQAADQARGLGAK